MGTGRGQGSVMLSNHDKWMINLSQSHRRALRGARLSLTVVPSRQESRQVYKPGKESACNAADPNSIPGSGRSVGEGIDYPLQYSWVSFVAQLVKNPPAMWETWVRSLGWEDPLEKGKATHSTILAWRIPWTIHGVAKS